MNAVHVLACFLAVLAYAHATRECYQCSEADDGAGGKACTEKDPEVGDIPRIIVPDDAKQCLVCSKWVPNSGDVSRGCWTKEYFDDNYDNFNFKKSDRDSCEKINGVGEICICEANKCNGSGRLGFSLALLAVLAVAKFLF